MSNIDWDLVRWEQQQLQELAEIENDEAEFEK